MIASAIFCLYIHSIFINKYVICLYTYSILIYIYCICNIVMIYIYMYAIIYDNDKYNLYLHI